MPGFHFSINGTEWKWRAVEITSRGEGGINRILTFVIRHKPTKGIVTIFTNWHLTQNSGSLFFFFSFFCSCLAYALFVSLHSRFIQNALLTILRYPQRFHGNRVSRKIFRCLVIKYERLVRVSWNLTLIKVKMFSLASDLQPRPPIELLLGNPEDDEFPVTARPEVFRSSLTVRVFLSQSCPCY